MANQYAFGGLFCSDGTIIPFLEDVADASEDILHTEEATTTSIGNLHPGKTVTHAWCTVETGVKYGASFKRAGHRQPIPTGAIGSVDWGGGKMQINPPWTLKDGDDLVIWTEP